MIFFDAGGFEEFFEAGEELGGVVVQACDGYSSSMLLANFRVRSKASLRSWRYWWQ